MVVHEPHGVPLALPLEHVGPDRTARLSGEHGWIWISICMWMCLTKSIVLVVMSMFITGNVNIRIGRHYGIMLTE